MPHQGWWVGALVVTAMATGVGFGISPRLGAMLAVVTFAVYVCLGVYAYRFGRQRRREGRAPDLSAIGERLRTRLKWHALLVGILIVTTSLALALDQDRRTPTWILLAPPVLLAIGIVMIWLTVRFVLPRAQRRRETQTSDADEVQARADRSET